MNTNLFRAKMAENGISVAALSDELGLSHRSVYDRLNGKAVFSVKEIQHLKKIWNLSADDINAIFFESAVN